MMMLKASRTNRPVILDLRKKVETGRAEDVLDALVPLYFNLGKAIAQCLAEATRDPDRMEFLAANVAAYRQAMDAVERMDEALKSEKALEPAYDLLEDAVVAIDGLVADERRVSIGRWERMADTIVGMLDRLPQERETAFSLLKLADEMTDRGLPLKAFQLVQRARRLASDAELASLVRRVSSRMAPAYHLPMMHDVRRNEAWERALRKAVRPGMRVLEIGTGAGMLSMMAARAGAEKVITCEYDAVVADVARAVVAENGFADRIEVIHSSSLDLHLDERLDLVFCDNYADNFFGFQPLQSVADARARLLKPGAPSLPARASVRLALAEWEQAPRFFGIHPSAGFSLQAAAPFVPECSQMSIGDRDMRLCSDGMDAFRFDFADTEYPSEGSVSVKLRADADGQMNGIAQWIRLELDDETFLECRPEPGAVFFSNPIFYGSSEPLQLKAGQVVEVHAAHDGNSLCVWI